MSYRGFSVIALAVLILAVPACKGSAPATPLPPESNLVVSTPSGKSPGHLRDRPLCGLTPPEQDGVWRQHWRSVYSEGGVKAVLKHGQWLWIATPQALLRLDRESLACASVGYAGDDPSVFLAGVHSLVKDPSGCLWAAGTAGVARRCTDASDLESGWESVRLEHYVSDLAFDVDGNLWTFLHSGRGGMASFRYEGHVPPTEGVWYGEWVAYQDVLPPDCDNWFSRGWYVMGYDPGNYVSRFQSPQECRSLMAWRKRVIGLALPGGLEPFVSYAPLAVDGEAVWLFVSQPPRSADGPARYQLVRYDGHHWTAAAWPFVPPDSRTMLVADETRGGVWIGSPDGLIFGDGRSVQKMPVTARDLIPVGPDVSSLTRDKSGRLWAATDQGLFLLDEVSDRWQPTEIDDVMLVAPDDRGGVWALSYDSGGQVSHFDGEHWRHHQAAPPCIPRDIAADVGGGLWMSGYSCELMGFDGQQWVSYGGGSDIQGALLDRGSNGELYAALRDDRIQRYDGTDWALLPAPDRHNYQLIETMAVDRHNGVWVGYPAPPYLRYFDGKKWHEFSVDVSVPVGALSIDAQGRLWVGGGDMLLRYDGKDWKRIPIDTWVRTLAADRRGRVWVAGSTGLYIYDPDD